MTHRHEHRSRRHSSEIPDESRQESRPHAVRDTTRRVRSESRHGKPRRHVIEKKLARKQRLQAVGVAAFVIIIMGIVMLAAAYYHQAARDRYALWDTARAVIHYMETHNGAWPRQWAELKADYYDLPTLMGGQSWAELMKRVNVDFTANPATLARCDLQADKAPFQVIFLKSGKHRHLDFAEPNTLILEYLKKLEVRQLRENAQPATPEGTAVPAVPAVVAAAPTGPQYSQYSQYPLQQQRHPQQRERRQKRQK